jgi:hypothetical protein
VLGDVSAIDFSRLMQAFFISLDLPARALVGQTDEGES